MLSTVSLCVYDLWIMLWVWLATQRADGELGQVDSLHLLLIYIICKNVSKEKKKTLMYRALLCCRWWEARPLWDNSISTWITSLNQHLPWAPLVCGFCPLVSCPQHYFCCSWSKFHPCLRILASLLTVTWVYQMQSQNKRICILIWKWVCYSSTQT